MHPPRVLLVVALLAAGAFSGCFSGGDEPESTPATETAGEVDAPETNDTAVDDGTKEMPTDVGHQPHVHDYWMGKERVTLMDEAIDVDAQRAIAFTFMNTFRQKPAVGGASFQLPDGQVVFEGTGQVEVTISWNDPTTTGVALRYRDASSTSFSEPAPVTSGHPLTIVVTPEMSDMPHSKTSRWAFFLEPAQAGQSIFGKLQVKVDAIRMGDIMLFPGHPELFGDAHTLVLFDGQGTSTQSNAATQIVGFATGSGGQNDDTIIPQKVVPMETVSMTANLTIVSTSASVGQVSDVMLLVKPADTNRYQRAHLVASDAEAGTYTYAWTVEMPQTDSPYAAESQWRFDVRVNVDPTGLGGSCGGCADAEVEYALQVVAYDGAVPDAEPLSNGGRGG